MAQVLFQELEVFRAAEKLADAVFNLVTRWEPFYRDSVGLKLVQSLDAIGVAIAVGHAKGMPKEHRRAVRSAFNETTFWLRRGSKRGLLTADEVSRIEPHLDDLGRRITSFLKKAKAKARAGGEKPAGDAEE